MSEGKISKLNTDNKIILIFSILIENKTPKTIPLKVAQKPIDNPVRKKFFLLIYC